MSGSVAQPDSRPVQIEGGRLFGVVAAVALLLASPVAAMSSDFSPILAWGLAFLPGVLVLRLSPLFRNAKSATGFVLVSTALRLGVAGVGAVAALLLCPWLPRNVFLFWLVGMYLLALAVEVYLTLAKASVREGLGVLLQSGDATNSGLREAGR